MYYAPRFFILSAQFRCLAATIAIQAADLSDYDKERGLKRGADGRWTSKSGGSPDSADPEPAAIITEEGREKLRRQIHAVIGTAFDIKQAIDVVRSDAFKDVSKAVSDTVKKVSEVAHDAYEKTLDTLSAGKEKLKDVGQAIGDLAYEHSDQIFGAVMAGLLLWGTATAVSGVSKLAVAGAKELAGEGDIQSRIKALKGAGDLTWTLVKLLALSHVGEAAVAFDEKKDQDKKLAKLLQTSVKEMRHHSDAVRAQLKKNLPSSDAFLKMHDVELDSRLRSVPDEISEDDYPPVPKKKAEVDAWLKKAKAFRDAQHKNRLQRRAATEIQTQLAVVEKYRQALVDDAGGSRANFDLLRIAQAAQNIKIAQDRVLEALDDEAAAA